MAPPDEIPSPDVIAWLRNENLSFSAVGVKPEHDKQARMSIQSSKFESARVRFPRDEPWLIDLETELFTFPNGRHDDQVDSTL